MTSTDEHITKQITKSIAVSCNCKVAGIHRSFNSLLVFTTKFSGIDKFHKELIEFFHALIH